MTTSTKKERPLLAAAVFLSLVLLVVSSFNQLQQTSRALLIEDKARLGSTPPSCHNKCNECHPCIAVQDPTLPKHNRVEPDSTRNRDGLNAYALNAYVQGNRYSNYKPLEWKCHCGDHFYNP